MALEPRQSGVDILVALTEAAGKVVSQSELIARAWPNVVVGEGSSRVTIAGLQEALGDGQDGIGRLGTVQANQNSDLAANFVMVRAK
jgi:DNA-binding winged helix-turn-helix (wHTH) protein